MNNTDNVSFVNAALETQKAFAVWREPQASKVKQISCTADKIIKLYTAASLDAVKGFVFAPFQISRNFPIYVIPFNCTDNHLLAVNNKTTVSSSHTEYSDDLQAAKELHAGQMELFMGAFAERKIKKAVLSRNQKVSGYGINQMPALFNKLCSEFINSFVYMVYIPDAGFWVGATPELLFKTNNGTASTVSLAGTQKFKEGITWGKKEQVEQELVTEHIRSVLGKFDIYNFETIGPETVKTGELAHIKTTLNFPKEKIAGRFGEFIENLHPTPAICGLPVNKSLELILKTENYDRTYYCGFLGSFDSSQQTDLYVNLRCLQAFNDSVVLYAGGGITPDSDTEKEWEETCMKMQNLEAILKDI